MSWARNDEVMLTIKTEGRHLSASQAKTLDGEFFLSRPFEYFNSRIASLLEAQQGTQLTAERASADFFAALKPSDASSLLEFDERDRRLQVAADSFALRHHVSEGLIRFLHALVVFEVPDGDARCVWRAIADGPVSLMTVVQQVTERLNEERNLFPALFLDSTVEMSEMSEEALTYAVEWTNHAIKLLTDDQLTTNAAHNKFKHGLAVRGRDDLRLEFVPADAIPSGGGDIPLSALEGSVPIFDRPLLMSLGHPVGRPRLGLEVTTLRIDVPIVLAEAWTIANVYGAVFHIAAAEHFEGTEADIAPYRTLPVGMLPDDLLKGEVLGLRQSVTSPPDGTTPARDTRLFLHGSSMQFSIDFDGEMHGTIVDR
jgi:hypothetical protein